MTGIGEPQVLVEEPFDPPQHHADADDDARRRKRLAGRPSCPHSAIFAGADSPALSRRLAPEPPLDQQQNPEDGEVGDGLEDRNGEALPTSPA